jgi:hypothetical protein
MFNKVNPGLMKQALGNAGQHEEAPDELGSVEVTESGELGQGIPAVLQARCPRVTS